MTVKQTNKKASELKNTFDGPQTQQRREIIKFEDWPVERFQGELQRKEKGVGVRGECLEQCTEELWDNLRWSNQCVSGGPEGGEIGNEQEDLTHAYHPHLIYDFKAMVSFLKRPCSPWPLGPLNMYFFLSAKITSTSCRDSVRNDFSKEQYPVPPNLGKVPVWCAPEHPGWIRPEQIIQLWSHVLPLWVWKLLKGRDHGLLLLYAHCVINVNHYKDLLIS